MQDKPTKRRVSLHAFLTENLVGNWEFLLIFVCFVLFFPLFFFIFFFSFSIHKKYKKITKLRLIQDIMWGFKKDSESRRQNSVGMGVSKSASVFACDSPKPRSRGDCRSFPTATAKDLGI